MPIFIIPIGDAMGKIFWVCFNAKCDVIKCAILWNLWEFKVTSSYSNGCAVCGMFNSLKQLQGGVMGGDAKPSVNNIINIEVKPMKGV